MDKQLKDLSEVEIKAIKADMYEQLSMSQQNLAMLNQELASRNKPEQVEAEKVEDTNSEEE